jgi:hypothetical protein
MPDRVFQSLPHVADFVLAGLAAHRHAVTSPP